MIDALHLIWIIPCSMIGGYLLCALLSANSSGCDAMSEWKDE